MPSYKAISAIASLGAASRQAVTDRDTALWRQVPQGRHAMRLFGVGQRCCRTIFLDVGAWSSSSRGRLHRGRGFFLCRYKEIKRTGHLGLVLSYD